MNRRIILCVRSFLYKNTPGVIECSHFEVKLNDKRLCNLETKCIHSTFYRNYLNTRDCLQSNSFTFSVRLM